ncbi:MAG: glycosyltransferase family 2 protein [Lachnospiraceae bacterium]|nr:glycosyltransferase family 2 protein [Lachnospiraceae bacterium]
MEKNVDISIIMPCLNEEAAVGYCVDEALEFIKSTNVPGEVIVVDNGSTDNSKIQAVIHGAKVVEERKRGYGNAIRRGLAEATGEFLMIGDCDTTYSFWQLDSMYSILSEGSADVVIGNRFAGKLENGAISLSHRIGVKALSFLARLRFQTDVYDFHCGLRAISKNAYKKLNFKTGGMEFATEFIAEAAKKNLKIAQVPVSLKICSCDRESKLNTIKDGFRHLFYILDPRI